MYCQTLVLTVIFLRMSILMKKHSNERSMYLQSGLKMLTEKLNIFPRVLCVC
uniref:Uncharacterized protein n=1 Tax=Anguilla anguilla TaxID=7936 RepID=A0A0E9T023_ANGAN